MKKMLKGTMVLGGVGVGLGILALIIMNIK